MCCNLLHARLFGSFAEVEFVGMMQIDLIRSRSSIFTLLSNRYCSLLPMFHRTVGRISMLRVLRKVCASPKLHVIHILEAAFMLLRVWGFGGVSISGVEALCVRCFGMSGNLAFWLRGLRMLAFTRLFSYRC